VFVRDKDIDALRAGIRAEAERDLQREASQRFSDELSAREYVWPPQAPTLTTASELAAGDVLLHSDGRMFWHAGTIQQVEQRPGSERRPADLWILVDDDRGGYGQAFKPSDTVLVLDRGPAFPETFAEKHAQQVADLAEDHR
jgi:hypothetical protein